MLYINDPNCLICSGPQFHENIFNLCNLFLSFMHEKRLLCFVVFLENGFEELKVGNLLKVISDTTATFWRTHGNE